MDTRRLLLAMALGFGTGSALGGPLPFTFSPGMPARAAEVNANFEALDQRLGAVEKLQSGRTTSDGSIDKSPEPPDLGGCSTASCIIGGAAYPAGNWVYLARYSLPASGVLTVVTGPAVACQEGVAAGTTLRVSMAIADETNLPPVDPTVRVIGSATVTIPSILPPGYALRRWDGGTTELTGRFVTAGMLTPGAAYKVFLYAEVVAGSTAGQCAFVESPVILTFVPTSIVEIAPLP